MTAYLEPTARAPLPMLIGPLSVQELYAAVPAYAERSARYEPDALAMDRLQQLVGGDVSVIVAMGTWCSDALREVPRFLRVVRDLEARDVVLDFQLIACDREKEQPAPHVAAFRIDVVPTFVVYVNGTEAGRIVERPAASIESDLLALLEQRPA